MASLGIDAQTADALIDKLAAGILPDSMTGAVPVSETTEKAGNQLVTRSIYADGSVNQVSMQMPSTTKTIGLVTPMLGGYISECAKQKTPGYYTYYNCLVRYQGIVSWDSHRVDYNVNQTTMIAHVIRNYSATANCIGGAISGISLTIPRSTQAGSAPAVSRLSYHVSAVYNGSPLSFTAWTELRLVGLNKTVAYG